MQELVGLGVALVTPFNKKGEIDYEGLLKLLCHTAENGVGFWVVMGSTGEAITLSDKEQIEVLTFITKNNPDQLPIIFGIGGNNTATLVERLQEIDLSKVTAILSSSPAYNKPTQTGIIAHFTKLANVSPKPILLYNVPGRTASNMLASTTIELSKHPNIIGIKEASGDLLQVMEIINGVDPNFIVTSGDDLLTPSMTSIGGRGAISVLANALPKEFSLMVKSGLAGDFKTCRNQAFQLLAINKLMYQEGNPTGLKELLFQLGICGNEVRLPLVSASNNLSKEIAKQI
jgi:4-hydroxy-tetrahydrodipicolinate synthase